MFECIWREEESGGNQKIEKARMVGRKNGGG
jgi:hypothetical protein